MRKSILMRRYGTQPSDFWFWVPSAYELLLQILWFIMWPGKCVWLYLPGIILSSQKRIGWAPPLRMALAASSFTSAGVWGVSLKERHGALSGRRREAFRHIRVTSLHMSFPSTPYPPTVTWVRDNICCLKRIGSAWLTCTTQQWSYSVVVMRSAMISNQKLSTPWTVAKGHTQVQISVF